MWTSSHFGVSTGNNLRKLFHEVIDESMGRVGPSFEAYASVWSLEEFLGICHDLRRLANMAIKASWTTTQMQSEIEASDDRKLALIETLTVRADDLREIQIEQINNMAECYLRDFDWKLNYILASDQLAHIREPLLTLDLDLGSAGQHKVHTVEFSRAELDSAISSLEAAYKVMNQLET